MLVFWSWFFPDLYACSFYTIVWSKDIFSGYRTVGDHFYFLSLFSTLNMFISDKKSEVILIFVLCIEHVSFLWGLWKFYLLSLILSNLVMTVKLYLSLALGVCWDSWIDSLLAFLKFWQFLFIISSNDFSVLFSLLSSEYSSHPFIRILDVVLQWIYTFFFPVSSQPLKNLGVRETDSWITPYYFVSVIGLPYPWSCIQIQSITNHVIL